MSHRLLSVLRHDMQGTTLLEFALVAPILLLMIFGLLDLGWGVFTNNTCSLAAREGARLGIISTTTDEKIRERVKAVSTGMNLQDEDIAIERFASDGSDFITVTVNYDYTPFTPLIGRFIPGGALALSGKATMYVE